MEHNEENRINKIKYKCSFPLRAISTKQNSICLMSYKSENILAKWGIQMFNDLKMSKFNFLSNYQGNVHYSHSMTGTWFVGYVVVLGISAPLHFVLLY